MSSDSSDEAENVQVLSDLINSLSLDISKYNSSKLAPCAGLTSQEEPPGNNAATAACSAVEIQAAGRPPASAAAALPVAAASFSSYDCLPRRVTSVRLNLQLAVPVGFKLQFTSLPGLTAAGLLLQPSTVYHSAEIRPVYVQFYNSTEQILKIRKNQRVCSLVFSPHTDCRFTVDKEGQPKISTDTDSPPDTAIADDGGRSFVDLSIDHMDRIARDPWRPLDPSGLL